MKISIVMVYDKASVSGGAGKIAINSAIMLQQTGLYNVYFFSASGPVSTEMVNNGVTCICLDMPLMSQNKNKLRAGLYGIWNFKAQKEFEKLLDSLSPENTVIHIHGWTKALSVSIFKTAKIKGYHTVVTLHDYFSVCPNGGFFNYNSHELCNFTPLSFKCILCNCDKRSYLQKLWRCCRQLLQNKYVRDNKNINYIYISNRILKLSKKYIMSNKFYPVLNPIELSSQMTLNHQNSNIYLCVGRISEEKGVENFCKAISLIQKKYNVSGRVLGVGPLLQRLKNKYPSIEFVGWVDPNRVSDYYKTSRALVFPSICNEGSPLTIPEAISAGLPCIVSDSTSATETVVDNVNGMIYSATDIADLVKKIEITLDDNKLMELQNNIHSEFNINKYSYDAYIDNLDRIYQTILKK